jgi:hypothetical protein
MITTASLSSAGVSRSSGSSTAETFGVVISGLLVQRRAGGAMQRESS